MTSLGAAYQSLIFNEYVNYFSSPYSGVDTHTSGPFWQSGLPYKVKIMPSTNNSPPVGWSVSWPNNDGIITIGIPNLSWSDPVVGTWTRGVNWFIHP